MSSCILYQNQEKTVVLLDIPRSLELAQGTPEEPCLRRLISCKPLAKPFPSLEPKSARARAQSGESSIQTLLLEKHIQLALEQVKKHHVGGPWCLPRVVSREKEDDAEGPPRKKQKKKKKKKKSSELVMVSSSEIPGGTLDMALLSSHSHSPSNDAVISYFPEIPRFYQNRVPSTTIVKYADKSRLKSLYMPPNSTLVNSRITNPESFSLPTAEDSFPPSKFNLILLDPPWPNRSVRRKHNYAIAPTTTDIHSLLTSIPIPTLLAPDGIVALWMTNKAALHTLILEPRRGMLAQWGLELIEEWVWVKITRAGEPTCAMDGEWRKPYEILLVARRAPAPGPAEDERSAERRPAAAGITRRVIFAVPDVHSRKPNLRHLVATSGLVPGAAGTSAALELFARNVTAGWWAWGDEAAEFQKEEYWVA